jgi:NAD+ synthase (glutamine-hydrolysing)
MKSGMRTLRVALAQLNLTVGDLRGNADRIIACIGRSAEEGADIVAFPELAVTGYPPEDLVLKPEFISNNLDELHRIASAVGDITAIVGFVDSDGTDVYNAAAIIQQGKVIGCHRKFHLPNYSVFDEQRYFRAGTDWSVYTVRGTRIGVTICEDIWFPIGPGTLQAIAGAEVIVNINASPYRSGKQEERYRMVATRASDELTYVCYLNLVGGQDELIFEGASMICDPGGARIVQGAFFEEDFILADLDVDAVFSARLRDTRRRQSDSSSISIGAAKGQLVQTPLAGSTDLKRDHLKPHQRHIPDPLEEIYGALVLGTRDYIRKSGFSQVVIGLSGGIDSSLTAAIAVDALGPKNVLGVSMPSRFSSTGSRSDAEQLALNLGVRCLTAPIGEAFDAYLRILEPIFAPEILVRTAALSLSAGAQGDPSSQPSIGHTPQQKPWSVEGEGWDITEENIQARIRGNLLMAITNKQGSLVLTTGNKSEMAVGYSTLYGDLAGGFAVLKDVFKTSVFDLCRWRNHVAGREIIPTSVIEKPPSAELRENQKDEDSLPPYEILDAILRLYVEQDRSSSDIVALGFDPATVTRVITLVEHSEYKRRQAPPGPKITTRAFGKDRRLPIVNRYRDIPDAAPTAQLDEVARTAEHDAHHRIGQAGTV